MLGHALYTGPPVRPEWLDGVKSEIVRVLEALTVEDPMIDRMCVFCGGQPELSPVDPLTVTHLDACAWIAGMDLLGLPRGTRHISGPEHWG